MRIPHNETAVAEDIYEAFYESPAAVDYTLYGGHDVDHFYLKHDDTGKRYRVQIIPED